MRKADRGLEKDTVLKRPPHPCGGSPGNVWHPSFVNNSAQRLFAANAWIAGFRQKRDAGVWTEKRGVRIAAPGAAESQFLASAS